MPDATKVAGFGAWKKMNRFVKKGEKGITIIAPIFKKDGEDEDNRKEVRFRASCVFDISQTDGEKLAALNEVAGDPGHYMAKLKEFVQQRKIELVYSDTLNGALGMSTGGKIFLKSGLSVGEEFSVLAHEVAHELMHQGKLNVDELKLIENEKFTQLQRQYAKRAERALPNLRKPSKYHVYSIETKNFVDESALLELGGDPNVEYVQRSYQMTGFFTPRDFFYMTQGSWGQDGDDLWGLKKINIGQAWDLTQGTYIEDGEQKEIVVAVVDE